MTRKRRRLWFVAIGFLALAGATGLVLSALNDTLVYFLTPSELKAKALPEGRRVRLGGLVEKGSVVKDGNTVRFTVTDLTAEVTVTYTGILPDLFREGQGVVTEGKLDGRGVFQASEVLAKHDENYMPKEVADALKKSGHWKDDYATK